VNIEAAQETVDNHHRGDFGQRGDGREDADHFGGRTQIILEIDEAERSDSIHASVKQKRADHEDIKGWMAWSRLSCRTFGFNMPSGAFWQNTHDGQQDEITKSCHHKQKRKTAYRKDTPTDKSCDCPTERSPGAN